jgi:hypothetical protein
VAGPALTRADGFMAQAIALAFHSPFAHGVRIFTTLDMKVLSTQSHTAAGGSQLWTASVYSTRV